MKCVYFVLNIVVIIATTIAKGTHISVLAVKYLKYVIPTPRKIMTKGKKYALKYSTVIKCKGVNGL